MKENESILEAFFTDALERLEIPSDDTNIEERRKMFYAGISSLYMHMGKGMPKDKKEANQFTQQLAYELNIFWDKERIKFEQYKNKEN